MGGILAFGDHYLPWPNFKLKLLYPLSFVAKCAIDS